MKYEQSYTSKLTDENYQLRRTFDTAFPVFETDNKFAYWLTEPKHSNRLTPWKDIQEYFKLTKSTLNNLVKVFDQANAQGVVNYNDLVLPNSKRSVNYLIQRRVAKEIYTRNEHFIVINPSVMFVRDWWSPFMQGVLLTQYKCGVLLDIKVNSLVGTQEHQVTLEGITVANNLVNKCTVY